jgi:hypothetical protein
MDDRGQAATSIGFILFFVSFAIILVYLSVQFESGLVTGVSTTPPTISCSISGDIWTLFGIPGCMFSFAGAFLALMSFSTSYAVINGTIIFILLVGLAWVIFETIVP